MIIQDYVIKLQKLFFMKTHLIIPFFFLGITSLFAQATVKRSNIDLKETIIRTDTRVKVIKEIELKKDATTTPQKVAILPKKSKKQK